MKTTDFKLTQEEKKKPNKIVNYLNIKIEKDLPEDGMSFLQPKRTLLVVHTD